MERDVYVFRFAFDQGDRLRKALAVSGLSVAELAEALGVHRNTVGRWINGHTRPNRAELEAFARATGAPLGWLETGQQPALAA